MMSEPTVTRVDARLDKLEQDNRRLKLTLGALLLALAAVPLIGAVMPEQIPEVINARMFRVIDYDGTVRAGMQILGISAHDEHGNIRAYIDSLSGISYRDENGETRASMYDGGIRYYDENNNLRAQLGRVWLDTPSTGATTTYPAQVVLYDDDNNVIWQAVGR